MGPNANLSDIKNLVSFEKEMFGDSSDSTCVPFNNKNNLYYRFHLHIKKDNNDSVLYAVLKNNSFVRFAS